MPFFGTRPGHGSESAVGPDPAGAEGAQIAVIQNDRAPLVDEMVQAYNARDVDRMLSYFADDAVILDAEGAVMDAGRAALRETFA